MFRILCIAILFVAPLAAKEWQPKKTWVFAVGILEFKAGISGWPEEGRVDAKMIQAYKDRGVPENQIVFLKNKAATKKAIEEGLATFAAKAAKGDTLVFYYAGHGGRDYTDAKRPVSIIPYDSVPGVADSNILVTRILDIIEEKFTGSTVFLNSDCCHSGAFAEVAKVRAKKSNKINYGVLTSAHVSSKSTGNWTYTECLVDMLNGNALLDTNGDGEITFTEVASYTESEMAFAEQQLSCSLTTGTFSATTVMAKAGDKPKKGVGARLEAKEKGVWYRAKVLETREGEYKVHRIGYPSSSDSWVSIKDSREWKPEAKYKVGQTVEAKWENTWYKATIVKTHLGLHYVHYDQYPDSDDEWVPMNRIRKPAKAPADKK